MTEYPTAIACIDDRSTLGSDEPPPVTTAVVVVEDEDMTDVPFAVSTVVDRDGRSHLNAYNRENIKCLLYSGCCIVLSTIATAFIINILSHNS